MWSRLAIPWPSSRRTSPIQNVERRNVGPSRNAVSFQEGVSTTEETGLVKPRQIDTYQGTISSVQFLPDGKHIVIGSKDGIIRQYNLEAGNGNAMEAETRKLVHFGEEITMQVISKDGRWVILIGTDGRRVTVWDAITRERVVESTEAHEQKITALDISPDASKIASGSRDGTVIVWCLETGQRLAGPFKQGQSVLSIRFSPRGDRLASAGWNFSIYIWDFRSDSDRSVTCIPTDPAYSLAWSNDGHRLFVGCYRGSILCFDISSTTPIMSKWPGHPHFDSITTLCLSNNDKFIVSASSSECYVKIWDVHTRSELGFVKDTSEILDVNFSPDDGRLVSGTKDGKISLWEIRKLLPAPYFFYSLTTPLMSPFRSGSCPILTEINNTAYVSWSMAELARAEQILSYEIGRGSSASHYHLANRALLRVRLQQWDRALDDAQSSLLVKPSLVARIAMSAAQSGRERYNAAIETLDLACANCNKEEKDFVNLMKAITFFDAGFRDEAIRRMDELVGSSPGVKQPCAFVQAKMYALLATDAVNSQEHIKAISLFAQARDLCPSGQYPELDTISLISGWTFDGLKLAIYRQLCEACHAVGRTQEVSDILREMTSIFKYEIKLRRELHEWLIGFKSRCVVMFESHGDSAMQNKDYDSAIVQYSAALDIHPAVLQAPVLFVKRSEARAALCSWEDALKDADEAIRLNPSSPWGYERRHAALHSLERYEDAIEALGTMISILEASPDPEIRQLRGNYVDPLDTTKVILEVFEDSVHNSPFRLIDTTSGRLCDTEKRKKIFKEDPTFQEMVSSMTTQLHRERIDAVTRQYFQYVMLSHRWEGKELELADTLDKSIYDLEASPSATKLQQFCYLARDTKFRWAWSDTCCINKDKDVEFENSINSMFHWYRCSAATVVYLNGVPPLLIPGALKGSIWMTRGWTLQELLAPRVIRFYYKDWTPYLNNMSPNHKEAIEIMQELEDAAGITARDLLTFHAGPENVRVKLRLASTRETTVPVDMAYGLFGIFGVTMPVIHGESQQHALGRLFQEIVARSGDVACLAWVGNSSEFNSTFPDHIRVYEHPFRTIPYIGEDMEKRVVDLRGSWLHKEEAQAIAFYQRLNKLPPARCTNQRLHLPCIVFPLTMLKKVKQTDGTRMYRSTTNMLEDTEIYSKEKFLPRTQGPKDLVLVCPWIHELLDATPIRHGRHRRPSVEAASSHSGSDSEPESELERDTVAKELMNDTHGVSFPDSDPSLHSTQMNIALTASKLVVRFRQPLGALLLLALGRGQYKRVATDHDIIIRVRDEASLGDITLQTLEIL